MAVAADAELCALLEAGRDEQADAPLGQERPGSYAARAGLADTGRAGLDLEKLGDVQVRHGALTTRALTHLALRIRQPDGAATHASRAADDGLVAHQPASSLLGFETPNLEVDVDVFAACRLLRPSLPERLVETLIPPAAVPVAVIEQPCLAL